MRGNSLHVSTIKTPASFHYQQAVIQKYQTLRKQIKVNTSMNASLIFRIKAREALYSNDENVLSFKHGQEFFAIHTTNDNSHYLVTTNKSLPFARGSTSGLVPVSHFASRKGASIQQRRTAYQSQKATSAPKSISKDFLNLSLPPAPKKQRYSISLAGLTSGTTPAFKLVAQNLNSTVVGERRRSSTMQYIHQTVTELYDLDTRLQIAYPGASVPGPPSGGDEELINSLGEWADYLCKLGGFISRHVVDRETVFEGAEQAGRKRTDSGLALDILSLF